MTTTPATTGRSRRPRLLAFDTVVPRQLAHRRAVGEVLVTDSAQDDAHRFRVAVQIPRAHLLWGDHDDAMHDPLGVVEAARQAAIVVSHRYYGVPLTGRTGISHDVSFVADRIADLGDAFDGPLEGVFDVRVTPGGSGGNELTSLRFCAAFERVWGGAKAPPVRASLDGVEGDIQGADGPTHAPAALTLQGSLTFLDTTDYRALRVAARRAKGLGDVGRPCLARLADPTLVGRRNPSNVVIAAPRDGEERFACQIVADPRHPSFYDHPLDHLPGPLLAEALRQTALLRLARGGWEGPTPLLTEARATFAGFVEPEQPSFVAVLAADAETGVVQAEIQQAEQLCATATLRLSRTHVTGSARERTNT